MSKVSVRPPADLRFVAAGFGLPGKFVGGTAFGSGHINDTFVGDLEQAGSLTRYIFQRINHRVFTNVPALMENIQRVTAHAASRTVDSGAADASRRTITLVPALTGAPFLLDAEGNYWRCYLFIGGARTYDLVATARQAYEAARCFGQFQRHLLDLPGPRLHDTIPDFHHTRRRFEALRHAVKSDSHGRGQTAAAEIDFAFSRETLVDVLLKLQVEGKMPERVTHNDAKFNNVLLDDRSGEGLCVLDLDTVMPGLALHDFGDLIRSATNSAMEDETDLAQVAMRMPIFEGLVKGYVASAKGFLNEVECAHLAFAGKLITFEIGIRFLTDYLEGDVYFKTARAGHNLDRGRNQFALMRSIEKQEGAMQAFADEVSRKI